MTTPAKGEKKSPQFFTVPAGTRAAECEGCKATIYWIVTEAGKRMPVHCEVEGGLRPLRYAGKDPADRARAAGRGISHFVDCPMAGHFRRGS